jgi:hypothetical protein
MPQTRPAPSPRSCGERGGVRGCFTRIGNYPYPYAFSTWRAITIFITSVAPSVMR